MFLKQPIYAAFGLLVTGWTAWVQYSGAGYTSASEVKQVPKSVRDNPGSYRSHYGYVPRYFGGK